MTSTDGAAVLSVRKPADLICAVPYLLGFHPRESLVLIGLAGGQVIVTVRVDLDQLADPGALEYSVQAMRRGGSEALMAVVFDEREAPSGARLAWRGLVAQLDEVADIAGAPLEDAYLVATGRYWAYLCDDPRCCPWEGTTISIEGSEVAAAATFAGMVALPDRDSVADLLTPAPDTERAALRPALDAAVDRVIVAIGGGGEESENRAAVRALFARSRAAEAAAGSLVLEHDELAYFATALRRVQVRDSVWMAVDDGRLDGIELWRQLACRLPSPYDAAPLFLLAWSSWRRGSGALARIAADRALNSDPSYTAAELLHAALAAAVDPRAMPRLKRSETQTVRTKM